MSLSPSSSSLSRLASGLALSAGLLACETPVTPLACTPSSNTAPLHTVTKRVHTDVEATLKAMHSVLQNPQAVSEMAQIVYPWGRATSNIVRTGENFVECHPLDAQAISCGTGALVPDASGLIATRYTEVNAHLDHTVLYPADAKPASTLQRLSPDQCEAFDGTSWGSRCDREDMPACTSSISQIHTDTHQVYDDFLQKVGK